MNGKRIVKKAMAGLMSVTMALGAGTVVLPQLAGVTVDAAALIETADSSSVWNGNYSTSWYNSSKTVFYLSTPEQLAGLSVLVRQGNTMEGKTIVLTKDLVMNDTSNYSNWSKTPPKNNWVPIGANPNGQGEQIGVFAAPAQQTGLKVNKFKGTFDGNGHTITGLYCNHEETAGLFAYLEEAGVYNVILKSSYICADEPFETASSSSYNVWTKETDYAKFNQYYPKAGGIAAVSATSLISDCEFNGTVKALGHDKENDGQQGEVHAAAGGIVGRCHTSSGLVFVYLLATMESPICMLPASYETIKDMLSDKDFYGVVGCINRGSVYASYEGKSRKSTETDKAYAGGVVGSFQISEYDGAGAYLNVNLGKVTSASEAAGGVLGHTDGCRMLLNYCTKDYDYVGVLGTYSGTWAENNVAQYETKNYHFTNNATDKRKIAQKYPRIYGFIDNNLYKTCDLYTHKGAFLVSCTSMTMGKGETAFIDASLTDASVSNKKITWSSSDSNVASVSDTGKVTAKNTGTATITIKASTGQKKTCKVTVKAPATAIKFTNVPSSGTMTMGVGETFKFNSSVTSGASFKRTFTTSDSSVLKITGTTTGTCTVKALKTGTATVTVKTFNGKTASCKVTVKKAAASIQISPASLRLKVGQEYKITSSVKDGASYYRYFWSTDTSRAKIQSTTTATCTIKALKAGTCQIKVKTFNGKTAVCNITIS